MSAAKNRVAKQIQEEEPRAVYTHYYGSFQPCHLWCIETHQKMLWRQLMSWLNILCAEKVYSRRWTAQMLLLWITIHLVHVYHGQQCGQYVSTHFVASYTIMQTTLQCTWEEAMDIASDTKTTARIGWVSAQMTKFNFLFWYGPWWDVTPPLQQPQQSTTEEELICSWRSTCR